MNNLVDGMTSLVVGMERLGVQWAGGEAMVSLARDMMGISHRLDCVMVMVVVKVMVMVMVFINLSIQPKMRLTSGGG